MTWIEPFALETWIVNVFSGDQMIFFAISLIAIIGMAAYFKMPKLAMFFMLELFILMFKDYVPASIFAFSLIISAIIISITVFKLWNRT